MNPTSVKARTLQKYFSLVILTMCNLDDLKTVERHLKRLLPTDAGPSDDSSIPLPPKLISWGYTKKYSYNLYIYL